MVDATHISFAATDRSYFSLIKKDIRQRALNAGMMEAKVNQIDLVVAEMTSNLFKYADQGEILLGVFENNGNPYIELISLDHGPGIAQPSRMMEDGISTTNTMGFGLGSMKRLSDHFELYSLVGWGTIVLSRIYNTVPNSKKNNVASIHPLIVCKPGETVSGDGMAIKQNDKFIKIMLADGLGHGPEANLAVNEAANAFKVYPDFSPSETLRYVHQSIKKTRGAVANVLCYEFATNKWTSAGIGNILFKLVGPVAVKNHMSYNGIVGHNIPNTMNDQQYDGSQYNLAILCSDGIKTRWETNKYPMIGKYDPTILCAALYKDHARRTDDMSIVAIKTKQR